MLSLLDPGMVVVLLRREWRELANRSVYLNWGRSDGVRISPFHVSYPVI